MKLLRRFVILLALMLATLTADTSALQAAHPYSGWGWAKPLNQRQGMLYTSNRAFKQNSSSRVRRSTSFYRQRSAVRPSRRFVPSVQRSGQPSFFSPGQRGPISFGPLIRSR